MDIAPVGLPAYVEARYRQGWRHVVVTAAGRLFGLGGAALVADAGSLLPEGPARSLL